MLRGAELEAWVPRAHRAYAVASVALVLAMLDAAAWLLVAIPGYYASF